MAASSSGSRLPIILGCTLDWRKPISEEMIWRQRPQRSYCASDITGKSTCEVAFTVRGPGHFCYPHCRRTPLPAGSLQRSNGTAVLSASVAVPSRRYRTSSRPPSTRM